MGANDYHAKQFLSFPICDHDTLSQQNVFSKQFSRLGKNKLGMQQSQQFLVNIGTDDESVRRSALHSLKKIPIKYYFTDL